MLSFITRSIQAKLIAILLVMFALLAVTIGLTFNTFSSLDGSAPMINQAGAQRMRIYKMATLSNAFARSHGEERVAAGETLHATVTQFDEVQIGLNQGDAKYNLTGTNNSGIVSQLSVVDNDWVTYKENVETVLNSSDSETLALGRVNDSATALFLAAKTARSTIGTTGPNKAALDQGGAQRMRTYKMAFLANDFMMLTGSERADVGRQLSATMVEFEAVQLGLRNGDANFGLVATVIPEVRTQLQVVEADWMGYKSDLQVVLSAGSGAEAALMRVNSSATPMFAQVAQARALIGSTGPNGAALDQGGAQRMRAFRMAYLANNYNMATGDTRENLKAELMTVMGEFEAVQAGLSAGDASLGLQGSSIPAVLADLALVDEAWAVYKEDLNGVLAGSTDAAMALNVLDQSAPAFFANSNQAVTLISDDSQGVVASLKQLEIILLIVGAIVFAAVIWFIRATIVKQLTQAARAAERLSEEELPRLVGALRTMASGDLTQSFKTQAQPLKIASQDEVGKIGMSVNSIIERLDESGTAFNEMTDNMRGLIQQVAGTSVNLANASEELSNAANQAGQATQGIAKASQEVAAGAEQQNTSVGQTTTAVKQLSTAIEQISKGSQEQAEGVEQTSAIVAQVSTAIGEVARTAQGAAEGATRANEASGNGRKMVEDTIEGMGKIKTAVEAVSKQIADLGQQSEEIGKIVAVIDDIAAQTNLLALNAAIEAARAGEQGRGFAVVADEVRGLAERVTDATKEIANLIDNIQKGVGESVKAAEEGTTQVGEGVQLAEQAGAALGDITTAVEAVSDQIEQISASAEEVNASSDEMVKTIEGVSAIVEENSAATEEMAASSDEVGKSVDSIASIAEENSASTEEVSASAEQMTAQVEEVVASANSLSNMAQDLQTAVSVFKVADGGSSEASNKDGSHNGAQPGEYEGSESENVEEREESYA